MSLGGLGSRGGKIIGFFKSGAPIYASMKHGAAKIVKMAKTVDYGKAIAKTAEFGGHAALGTAGGAIAFAPAIAVAYQNRKFKDLGPRLQKELKENQVESKKTVRTMSEFNKVKVISTRKEMLKDKDLSDEEKFYVVKKPKKLYAPMEEFERGGNAAAYQSESGKEYVFASKKVNRQALGHELGHIRDYRSGELNPSDYGSHMGIIKGKQVEAEQRAWDKSPLKGPKDEPLKTDALESYKVVRNTLRIHAGTSVAIGIGYSILRKL